VKPIVIPTDFSDAAWNAAVYAAKLAAFLKSELFIINIIANPTNGRSSNPLAKEIFENQEKMVNEKLKDWKERLEKKVSESLSVQTFLKRGKMNESLVEFCAGKAPFSVVMGIEKTASEIFKFGSHTLHAIQHLLCPVLAIPEGTRFAGIGRIAMAYDFDDFNRSVPINQIQRLKEAFQSKVDVLGVVTPRNTDPRTTPELISIKTLLYNLHPQYHFIKAATVEEGINQYLTENEADLLIMLPKHHFVFSLHKSHTEQIALSGNVPLMSIHE
jgi:nucleotide-binding universal stress UspA family protein